MILSEDSNWIGEDIGKLDEVNGKREQVVGLISGARFRNDDIANLHFKSPKVILKCPF